MKKCAIIGFFGKNEYRKKLLKDIILYFNNKNIDVIIASSDHTEQFEGVKNYITLKNVVDDVYVTPGILPYSQYGNLRFWRGVSYKKNINAANFFIKQHQISAYYANMLGYNYYYFLEFDAILKQSYFDHITSDSWDYSKFHVYNFTRAMSNSDYMTGFNHGNTSVAIEIYKQENLDWIKTECLSTTMFGAEQNLYHICQKYKDKVVEHSEGWSDVFEKFNMFSINNSAEIYINHADKSFTYMQSKGDFFDNDFSVQLYIDDRLIFEEYMKFRGHWKILQLIPYRNYTIKYFDAPASDYTLHKSVNIYTDPNDTTIYNNWVQYV